MTLLLFLKVTFSLLLLIAVYYMFINNIELTEENNESEIIDKILNESDSEAMIRLFKD